MVKKTVFTTYDDLVADIEDGMGSGGCHKCAEKMADYFLENEYFQQEWNGIFATQKYEEMDDSEWFELWEKNDCGHEE